MSEEIIQGAAGTTPAPAPRRPRGRPRTRLLVLIAGVAVAVTGIAYTTAIMNPGTATDVAGLVGDTSYQDAGNAIPASLQRPVVSAAGLADRLGIRLVYVATTGAGGLLDVRFQVLDPDKAAALHDAATPPVVIDDSTGVVADSLLMGHSHTAPFDAGVVYYLIFENPGNMVKRGGTVSVLLGNTEIDGVTVQ